MYEVITTVLRYSRCLANDGSGSLMTVTKAKFIVPLGACILLTLVQLRVLGRAECSLPYPNMGSLILVHPLALPLHSENIASADHEFLFFVFTIYLFGCAGS